MARNHDLPSEPTQETPRIERFALAPLSGKAVATETAALERLGDVELDVRMDLGHAYMRLEDALRLEPGAIVPLDQAAGQPVDILVGDRLIARGEILVLDDKYGVRVSELVAGAACV